MIKTKKKNKPKKLRFHTEQELQKYDPKYLLFISVRPGVYFSEGWRKDFSKFVYPSDWNEQKALNLVEGWLKQNIPEDDKKELTIVLERYKK